MMKVKFWLEPKDKLGLLTAMMYALSGDAHISFEGNLSKCDFSKIDISTTSETEALTRATLWPKQDFIVIAIQPNTIQTILDQVLPSECAVHDIIHIQIEKNGICEFGSYDNFDPECVVCGFGISEELLKQLVSQGILKSYTLETGVGAS